MGISEQGNSQKAGKRCHIDTVTLTTNAESLQCEAQASLSDVRSGYKPLFVIRDKCETVDCDGTRPILTHTRFGAGLLDYWTTGLLYGAG